MKTPAHMTLDSAVWLAKARLVAQLRELGYGVSPAATVRAVMRLARSVPVKIAAVEEFEAAVRPALVAYLRSLPKAARAQLHADAQFLCDHFDRFTEVPVTASLVKRVLTWVRRHYRALRQP